MKFKISLLLLTLGTMAMAADYKVDTTGMHAAVQFKISHLGTSWLMGRFDKFNGSFSYDAEHQNDSKIKFTVDTTSVNTNHAERDSHIRADGLLNTDKYPQATFVSQSFNLDAGGNGSVTGMFTLHGVEKNVSMTIKKVGEGKDPWGGYRVGFEGNMRIKLADYDITKNLGKTSKTLELNVTFEGVRQ
jgi:polyisoprenoid-binding protein YceI